MKRLWYWIIDKFFGEFKSGRQKAIFCIAAVISGVVWFFMDAVYENDWFGLNAIRYIATNGTEYTRGEQIEQLSGVLETVMTWWTLARWSYEIQSEQYPQMAKLARVLTKYFAVLKVDMMIVTTVFAFLINPFVFNYPKTVYYFSEFCVFVLNCLLFFVLPEIMRKVFVVQVKSGKKK